MVRKCLLCLLLLAAAVLLLSAAGNSEGVTASRDLSVEIHHCDT